MLIVSVSSEKHNRAAEELGIRSFSSLPILESSLLKKQTENFDYDRIENLFVLSDGVLRSMPTDTHFLPDVLDACGLYGKISKIAKNEKVFLFKNNVYFDCCFRDTIENRSSKTIVIKNAKSEKVFAVVTTAGELLHKLLNYENADTLFTSFFNVQVEYAVGYVKEITVSEDYKKLLFDIIHLLTPCKPPLLASGIFTQVTLPKGDFVIIPPVWFDDGVQIEDGAVIGPNTILMKDSLISKNTHIKNSIVMNDVYVSSECFVENSICCKGVCIKRGAVVCSNSVLGEYCTIGEDMTVENESFVRPYVKIELPYKSFEYREYEDFNAGGSFYGLTPEKAALLGAAIGTVYKKPRVCISSDGEKNSFALKLAVLSGLLATGSDCVDVGMCHYSAFFYRSVYCETQIGIFVSGKGDGTKIEIFEKYAKHIGRSACYNLICEADRKTFEYCTREECKTVTQVKGLRKMYIREIISKFSKPLNYTYNLLTGNNDIMRIVSEISEKLPQRQNIRKHIEFKTDDDGTVLTALYNGIKITHRELLSVAANSEKDNKILIDDDTLFYRDTSEFIIDLWKYDAVILMFKILSLLSDSEYDIIELCKNSPSFFVIEKTVKTPIKAGEIAERLDKSPDFSSNEIKTDKGSVKIKKEPHTNKLKVIAKAFSAEAAEELVSLTLTLVSNDSKM